MKTTPILEFPRAAQGPDVASVPRSLKKRRCARVRSIVTGYDVGEAQEITRRMATNKFHDKLRDIQRSLEEALAKIEANTARARVGL